MTDKAQINHITKTTVKDLEKSLLKENSSTIKEIFEHLSCADLSDAIDRLSPAARKMLFLEYNDNLPAAILTELSHVTIAELVELIGYTKLSNLVVQLDSDDAVYIVSTLDNEGKKQVLANIHDDSKRNVIEQGLSYPEGSAGRIMQREFISVPHYWTISDTRNFINQYCGKIDFRFIFVVNMRNKLVGSVNFSSFLQAQDISSISSIANKDLVTINVLTDEEDVAHVVRQYNLIDIPVIDKFDHILGIITTDDVIDVIDDAAEKDIMSLSGFDNKSQYSILSEIKARTNWLFINFLLSVGSAYALNFFKTTIESTVILVILLPIVASICGNAGIQSLAGTIRGITMKKIFIEDYGNLLKREFFVSLFTGLICAIFNFLAINWFLDNALLSLAVSITIIISVVIAGLIGILIPLTLEKLKIDPVLSSGVIMTTVIDILSIMLFFGIASYLLL